MPEHPHAREVTEVLLAWRQGDREALQRLVPLVYDELRRVAHARLRAEPPGHILQTTALVHEAYLRLVDLDRIQLRDRAHLLALAARLMRQILVDQARRRDARKRGGDVKIVGLDEQTALTEPPTIDVLALNEALTDLAALDPRLGRLVEVKFFAGLTIAETAAALDVSTATAERDWVVAKACCISGWQPSRTNVLNKGCRRRRLRSPSATVSASSRDARGARRHRSVPGP